MDLRFVRDVSYQGRLVLCKFPTDYVGERIVKIGQYLAKIWARV